MPQISAEARFVTLCAHEPDAVQSDVLHAAAVAVRDWDRVIEVAACHRVAGFVLQAATRYGLALAPEVVGTLRGQVLAVLTRVMVLDTACAAALAALGAAGIPVIVLKGPALARSLYPAAALRPYDDIDLTVQAPHEVAAAAALTAAGFHEVPFLAEDARRTRAGHVHGAAPFHRLFRSGDVRATLELHVDSLQLGLQPVCEAERWQRAVPVPRLPDALMLCPEDQVVQLSVHAHKHGFGRLIWLKDLDLLLRARGDGLGWNLVLDVARREGVCGSVWGGLRLTRGLLGTHVPLAAFARLRPAPPVRALYDAVWPPARIAALDGFMRRRGVQFHMSESWRGMLPSLILMGRRRDRARTILRYLVRR